MSTTIKNMTTLFDLGSDVEDLIMAYVGVTMVAPMFYRTDGSGRRDSSHHDMEIKQVTLHAMTANGSKLVSHFLLIECYSRSAPRQRLELSMKCCVKKSYFGKDLKPPQITFIDGCRFYMRDYGKDILFMGLYNSTVTIPFPGWDCYHPQVAFSTMFDEEQDEKIRKLLYEC